MRASPLPNAVRKLSRGNQRTFWDHTMTLPGPAATLLSRCLFRSQLTQASE